MTLCEVMKKMTFEDIMGKSGHEGTLDKEGKWKCIPRCKECEAEAAENAYAERNHP